MVAFRPERMPDSGRVRRGRGHVPSAPPPPNPLPSPSPPPHPLLRPFWVVLSLISAQCCFTSTETVRTIGNGESRTATSTFTQLLNSERSVVQCCFTSTETVRTIRDFFFYTAPELCDSVSFLQCCFTSTKTLRIIRNGELRMSTSSSLTQLLRSERLVVQCCFTATETVRTIGNGEPRTSTSIFTQLLSFEG